jgi:hypothetical protein
MSEHPQSLLPAFVSPGADALVSWRTVYAKTVWETDNEKLLTLIHATEEALYLRWQELGQGSEETAERAEMEAASRDLLAIKIHKLGWPDPCQ